jgi:DNA methylase
VAQVGVTLQSATYRANVRPPKLFEMEAALALPPAAEAPAQQRDTAIRSGAPERTVVGTATVELTDATERYEHWPSPTAIVVDGPYGVGGFPGDPPTPRGLAEWYAPHAALWAKHALPSTTLWFWGTEISWAIVHHVLDLHGWDYRSAHVWDKGVGHIAGNVNGNTIRRFPVVTEVCVQYTRRVELRTGEGELLRMKEWLRKEWQRSGLPLYKTNEACGVKNAATRKYFTQCHLWYFPPPDMMERLSFYANRHGRPTSHPYFSLDGRSYLTADQWGGMRAKWHHVHGITNVWEEPPVRGAERLRDAKAKIVHANQKPLRLIDLSIRACTDPSDVVWEPFGGLCSAAVASLRSDRACFSAEIDAEIYTAAAERLRQEGAALAANNGGDGRAAAPA